MRFLVSIFFISMLSFTFSFAVDGKTLYKKCRGCHGVDGRHVPYERQNGVIAGRDKMEIELIIKAIKDGGYSADKINKIMIKSISKFSDEDITEISTYISKFKK